MGKAYYTITPRDMEILAFAREVPYFDEDLIRKYFYAGKSGPEYVRKKLRYLELQGVLKGWRWVGLKKVYSISKPGERYLNLIAEGIKNTYFKPHLHLIFRPIETIKTEYIPHTLKLVDLLMHFISFRFFDQVFLFDNVLDKDSYTRFRPDIFITKAKHRIYFEYEATTKRPAASPPPLVKNVTSL